MALNARGQDTSIPPELLQELRVALEDLAVECDPAIAGTFAAELGMREDLALVLGQRLLRLASESTDLDVATFAKLCNLGVAAAVESIRRHLEERGGGGLARSAFVEAFVKYSAAAARVNDASRRMLFVGLQLRLEQGLEDRAS